MGEDALRVLAGRNGVDREQLVRVGALDEAGCCRENRKAGWTTCKACRTRLNARRESSSDEESVAA